METTFFTRMKGYRTVFVNAVVLLSGLLVALGVIDVGPDVPSIGDTFDTIIGGGAMLLGGVNIALRAMTSTGIFTR